MPLAALVQASAPDGSGIARRYASTAAVGRPAASRPCRPAADRPADPTLRLERKFWDAGDEVVCGIDEVGRGAWAGPVTVAAVIPAPEHVRGVRDSKQLTRPEREKARAVGARSGPSPSVSGTRRTRSATSSA